MLAVVCAVLGLSTIKPSCYRSSLFQTLNKVVQCTFLSSFSRKLVLFISLNNIIKFSKLQFFVKIISSVVCPQTHRFVIWSHRSCRLLHCHGSGCSWYSAILIILGQSIKRRWTITYVKYYLFCSIFGRVMRHNRRVRFFRNGVYRVVQKTDTQFLFLG